MSKHHLSHASELYFGDAFHPATFNTNGRNGALISPLTKISLGSPIAADADHLIDAATSTELPDTETVTYTTADDGTTPFDNADTPVVETILSDAGVSASVWPLDAPRNLVSVVTHGSSVVAMTIVITGYDQYMKKMVETHSITATGTTKTVNGAKAFAYIESFAITSAGNAETNTLNLGIGDVIGMPFLIASVADCMRVFFNDVLDDAATVVKGDATTVSATTGDVRGTVDPNSACDGSEIVAWVALDPSTVASLVGINQYGG